MKNVSSSLPCTHHKIFSNSLKDKNLFINEQKKVFNRIIRSFKKKMFQPRSFTDLIVEVGKLFLGRPYSQNHGEPYEYLHLNLRRFDCFTFIEHVIGFVLLLKWGLNSFEAFLQILKKVSFRAGKVKGYTSRLHYFTDWVYDNQKKGFLKDVTREIGGKVLRKTINYMSKHRESYPQLRNEKDLLKMKDIEKCISKRAIYFIPKERFRASEKKIEDGDIIGITTYKRGLDVEHVGIGVRVKGRIHLLHASSKEGMVLISKETLYRYLMRSKSRSGIIVARIC